MKYQPIYIEKSMRTEGLNDGYKHFLNIENGMILSVIPEAGDGQFSMRVDSVQSLRRNQNEIYIIHDREPIDLKEIKELTKRKEVKKKAKKTKKKSKSKVQKENLYQGLVYG